MYSLAYQLNHDMDCFLILNEYSIHIATNGGIVSQKLGTKEDLRAMQKQVANLEYVFDFELNLNYLNTLDKNEFPPEDFLRGVFAENSSLVSAFENTDYNNIPFHHKVYANSFVEMARKGFWSFDRIGLQDDGQDLYMPIAWPKKNYKECNPQIGYIFKSDLVEHYLQNGCFTSLPLMDIIRKSRSTYRMNDNLINSFYDD